MIYNNYLKNIYHHKYLHFYVYITLIHFFYHPCIHLIFNDKIIFIMIYLNLFKYFFFVDITSINY